MICNQLFMEYLCISDNEINKGNLKMVLCGLILNGNRSSSPPTLWTTWGVNHSQIQNALLNVVS